MLFPSSLPAHAASANGSSRIAARFADIPTCNPSVESPTPVMFLDRPRAKWNSLLGHRAIPAKRQLRPATIAEATAQAGMVPRPRRGNADRTAAAEYPQPRLAAGATCLIAAFED